MNEANLLTDNRKMFIITQNNSMQSKWENLLEQRLHLWIPTNTEQSIIWWVKILVLLPSSRAAKCLSKCINNKVSWACSINCNCTHLFILLLIHDILYEQTFQSLHAGGSNGFLRDVLLLIKSEATMMLLSGVSKWFIGCLWPQLLL